MLYCQSVHKYKKSNKAAGKNKKNKKPPNKPTYPSNV